VRVHIIGDWVCGESQTMGGLRGEHRSSFSRRASSRIDSGSLALSTRFGASTSVPLLSPWSCVSSSREHISDKRARFAARRALSSRSLGACKQICDLPQTELTWSPGAGQKPAGASADAAATKVHKKAIRDTARGAGLRPVPALSPMLPPRDLGCAESPENADGLTTREIGKTEWLQGSVALGADALRARGSAVSPGCCPGHWRGGGPHGRCGL
jgi:hypothetical protein